MDKFFEWVAQKLRALADWIQPNAGGGTGEED